VQSRWYVNFINDKDPWMLEQTEMVKSLLPQRHCTFTKVDIDPAKNQRVGLTVINMRPVVGIDSAAAKRLGHDRLMSRDRQYSLTG